MPSISPSPSLAGARAPSKPLTSTTISRWSAFSAATVSSYTAPGGLPIVYLDLGGTTVELMTYTGTKLAPRAEGEHLGYRMMALEVNDMRSALDELKAKGVDCTWGPLVRPAFARAEIRDPDGNSIELRQWIER